MACYKDLIAQAHVLPAFLAEFIDCLVNRPHEQVGEFYTSFEQRIGAASIADKNVVFTPGAILAVLYVLIVYPQERFVNEIPEVPTEDLDAKEWGRMDWHMERPKHLRDLVRRLRNALAHANVEVTSEFGFRFRDRRDAKSPFVFDVSMDLDAVRTFVEQLTRVVLSRSLKEPG